MSYKRYNESKNHLISAMWDVMESSMLDSTALNLYLNRRLQGGDSLTVKKAETRKMARDVDVYRLDQCQQQLLVHRHARHRRRRSSVTIEEVDLSLTMGAYGKVYFNIIFSLSYFCDCKNLFISYWFINLC